MFIRCSAQENTLYVLVFEINSLNSWTIHEDVSNSVDLILRDISAKEQIRQNYLPEKVEIKCQETNLYSNFIFKNLQNTNSDIIASTQLWIELNFIKEAMTKLNIKFALTNDIKKASLIVGLKKHLKSNLKLKQLAEQKQIPIYALNQLSIYQFLKLIQKCTTVIIITVFYCRL